MTESLISTDKVSEVVSLLVDLKSDIQQQLINEYNHGFDDAFKVITAGLEASLKKAQSMPNATNFLDGQTLALHVVKEIREEFNKQVNKNTAETQENQNV